MEPDSRAERLRRRMEPELPARLVRHIDRVVELGTELAQRHGLAVATVRLAARGHDLLRAVPPEELLARADRRGLDVHPVERREPVLLHGPLGAIELAERLDITDEDVLHAIRWHTTGHPDYTPEAWAMFIADKVEPAKLRRRPALARVRALAESDLAAAALAYLDLVFETAVADGWQVHPMANETRNALVARTAQDGRRA